MDANAINYLRRQPRSAMDPRPQQAPAASSARATRRSFFRRLFRRREEATTFHRCLAVHMVHAERESILR